MSSVGDSLTASARQLLESSGLGPDHPAAAAVAGPVLRGNNCIVAVPLAPAYAVGVAAGLVTRLAEAPERRALILTGPEAAHPFGTVFGRYANAATVPFLGSLQVARAGRHLGQTPGGALLTSPDTAVELLRQSALPLATLTTIVVIGPELWLTEELAASIFQDLPKETQRVFITADPAGAARWIERYAWRATVVGPLAQPKDPGATPPVIRTVAVQWHDRLDRLVRLGEELDLARLTVWTADRANVAAIEIALSSTVPAVSVVVDAPPPSGTTTVFFDPPFPDQFGTADALFFMPPGTELYFRGWSSRTVPVTISPSLSAARDAAAGERALVAAALATGDQAGSLALLAPLFEEWDAPLVAAALHQLWRRAATAPPEVARAKPVGGPTVKVWVSAGRKDGGTPGDLMTLLTRELAWDRSRVARIEVRETFSLIHVGSETDARAAVEGLAGLNLSGRRLTVRVDRGRPAKPRDRTA